MESVSHAGCVIGILAPGKIQSEALKKVSFYPPSFRRAWHCEVENSQADAKIETSTVIEGVQTSPIVPTKPLEEDTPMLDATIVAPTASTSQTTTTATTKDEEIATEKGEEEKPKRAGIVLAAEKRVTSKLLDKDAGGGREKILSINKYVSSLFSLRANAERKRTYSNILAGVAGMTADANSLVSFARNAAQGHLSTFNEDMPVEQLVRRVCDLKQGYTQYGGTFVTVYRFNFANGKWRWKCTGLRPFGVSFLFAGHDPHYQFQLYASDPSGNYRLVSLPYMLISSGADQVNETNRWVSFHLFYS